MSSQAGTSNGASHKIQVEALRDELSEALIRFDREHRRCNRAVERLRSVASAIDRVARDLADKSVHFPKSEDREFLRGAAARLKALTRDVKAEDS